MSTTDLRESIIEKIRHTDDEELLDYLNKLLTSNEDESSYTLSEFEKNLLAESKANYLSGKITDNNDIVKRNKKWLGE